MSWEYTKLPFAVLKPQAALSESDLQYELESFCVDHNYMTFRSERDALDMLGLLLSRPVLQPHSRHGAEEFLKAVRKLADTARLYLHVYCRVHRLATISETLIHDQLLYPFRSQRIIVRAPEGYVIVS